MLDSISRYIYKRKARSHQYRERRKRYFAESYRDLVASAIPIFVAAGIVGCTETILYVITDNLRTIIGLNILYVILIYISGKAITYHVSVNEKQPYESKIFQFITKYRLSKLLKNTTAEHVGFALKKLTVLLALEVVYTRVDWSAAFGVWIALVFSAITTLLSSDYLQRKVFQLPEELNLELVMFDAEAFPLPTAYLLTSLLAVGFNEIGVKYASDNSYLFSWNTESEYEPDQRSHNGFFALYCVLVSLLVSYLQAKGFVNSAENFVEQIEPTGTGSRLTLPMLNLSTVSPLALPLERNSIYVKNDFNQNNLSNSIEMKNFENNDIESSEENNKNEFEIKNNDFFSNNLFYKIFLCWLCNYELPLQCRQGILEFWDNSWGYFSGVAWFILILDNFKVDNLTAGSHEAADFILIAFSAVCSSIFCVNFMTSLKMRQWVLGKKHAKRMKRWDLDDSIKKVLPTTKVINQTFSPFKETKENGVKTSQDVKENSYSTDEEGNENSEGPTEVDKKIVWHKFVYFWLVDYLVLIRSKQCDVMILSFRLTVGWLWEVVVEGIFELTGTEHLEDKAISVFVEIGLTTMLLFTAFFIHVYSQDWSQTDKTNGDDKDNQENNAKKTVRFDDSKNENFDHLSFADSLSESVKTENENEKIESETENENNLNGNVNNNNENGHNTISENSKKTRNETKSDIDDNMNPTNK